MRDRVADTDTDSPTEPVVTPPVLTDKLVAAALMAYERTVLRRRVASSRAGEVDHVKLVGGVAGSGSARRHARRVAHSRAQHRAVTDLGEGQGHTKHRHIVAQNTSTERGSATTHSVDGSGRVNTGRRRTHHTEAHCVRRGTGQTAAHTGVGGHHIVGTRDRGDEGRRHTAIDASDAGLGLSRGAGQREGDSGTRHRLIRRQSAVQAGTEGEGVVREERHRTGQHSQSGGGAQHSDGGSLDLVRRAQTVRVSLTGIQDGAEGGGVGTGHSDGAGDVHATVGVGRLRVGGDGRRATERGGQSATGQTSVLRDVVQERTQRERLLTSDSGAGGGNRHALVRHERRLHGGSANQTSVTGVLRANGVGAGGGHERSRDSDRSHTSVDGLRHQRGATRHLHSARGDLSSQTRGTTKGEAR